MYVHLSKNRRMIVYMYEAFFFNRGMGVFFSALRAEEKGGLERL